MTTKELREGGRLQPAFHSVTDARCDSECVERTRVDGLTERMVRGCRAAIVRRLMRDVRCTSAIPRGAVTSASASPVANDEAVHVKDHQRVRIGRTADSRSVTRTRP